MHEINHHFFLTSLFSFCLYNFIPKCIYIFRLKSDFVELNVKNIRPVLVFVMSHFFQWAALLLLL
jgi:hypothetical protein